MRCSENSGATSIRADVEGIDDWPLSREHAELLRSFGWLVLEEAIRIKEIRARRGRDMASRRDNCGATINPVALYCRKCSVKCRLQHETLLTGDRTL
jgi:hypothetical protein